MLILLNYTLIIFVCKEIQLLILNVACSLHQKKPPANAKYFFLGCPNVSTLLTKALLLLLLFCALNATQNRTWKFLNGQDFLVSSHQFSTFRGHWSFLLCLFFFLFLPQGKLYAMLYIFISWILNLLCSLCIPWKT
jgi:hypothetical protein